MNKKCLVVSVFLLIVVALLVGCSSEQAVDEENNMQPAAQPSPSPAAVPSGVQGAEVTIDNFKFSPASLTVKAGTTVTWTNKDIATHTAKFSDWESDEMFQGSSASRTFSNAGTYSYVCGLHPSMKGTIIVQ